MRHRSLYEKLNNPKYIEQLSERARKELEIARRVLSENDLKSSSSIDVAYYKARKKIAREILSNINPSLADRILRNEKVPIFNLERIVERYYTQ